MFIMIYFIESSRCLYDILPGFNEDGLGAIINSSRGINYAYVSKINDKTYTPEEFGEAANASAQNMQYEINHILENNSLLAW